MKGMERNNEILSSGREVYFECDSNDQCNGQAGILKLLSSLTVEDQFQQELTPLLKIISPFNARATDCLYFHNTTFHCRPPDLRRCHRCTVDVSQQTSLIEHVCETCEVNEYHENFVERFKTFILTNCTEDLDIVALGCQLKGCNTVDNANLVYKASKITFNSDEYFKK